MDIERGTLRADVPHEFTLPTADVIVNATQPVPCEVCGQSRQAPAHARWAQVSQASRESARATIPRENG